MKFRKLPVEIEAVQLTKVSLPEVVAFLDGTEARQVWTHNDERASFAEEEGVEGYEGLAYAIPTLEGTMLAIDGDWIIKEPFPTGDRQFYPCKPDIFEATYEPVVD